MHFCSVLLDSPLKGKTGLCQTGISLSLLFHSHSFANRCVIMVFTLCQFLPFQVGNSILVYLKFIFLVVSEVKPLLICLGAVLYLFCGQSSHFFGFFLNFFYFFIFLVLKAVVECIAGDPPSVTPQCALQYG